MSADGLRIAVVGATGAVRHRHAAPALRGARGLPTPRSSPSRLRALVAASSTAGSSSRR